MSWTEERIKKLISLWCSGKSASTIAEELGDDITRNAVIGKIHRMGLMNRQSQGDNIIIETHKKKKPMRPHVPNKPKIQSSANHTAAPHKETHILVKKNTLNTSPPIEHHPHILLDGHHKKNQKITSVLGLTDKTCKWPIGNPDEPDFHFCGCAIQGNGPYCKEHATIAYTASPSIKIEKTMRQALAPRKEPHKEDLMGLF